MRSCTCGRAPLALALLLAGAAAADGAWLSYCSIALDSGAAYWYYGYQTTDEACGKAWKGVADGLDVPFTVARTFRGGYDQGQPCYFHLVCGDAEEATTYASACGPAFFESSYAAGRARGWTGCAVRISPA